MNKKYTLGKGERLKSRKATELLFRGGKRFNAGQLRVIYTIVKEGGVRMGVTVSSRAFSRAVDRNRVKRLLRETYRLQKSPLLDLCTQCNKGVNVFFVYSGKTIPTYPDVLNNMQIALNKLVQFINEDHPRHT